MVGRGSDGPSASAERTKKYGTRVPSALVANRWVIVKPADSNRAGVVLSSSAGLSIPAMKRLDGVTKSSPSSSTSSETSESTGHALMLHTSGADGNGRAAHPSF